MENKNWSVFYDVLKKNLGTIKDLFSSNDLVVDGNKVVIENNNEKDYQKEFDAWKKKLTGVVEVKESQKFDKLLSDNRELLKKREDTVEKLNQTIKDLTTKYKNEKQSCETACGAIDGLIENKEGWLDIMAEVIRTLNTDNENTLKEQKSKVEKQKNKTCRRFWWKNFCRYLLFVFCVAAQSFLFVIVGLEESCYHAVGIGVYLAVVALAVLLLSEAMLVRGILQMSKKKFYIKQRFEYILNKIEMKKVSKFEIDRDLEKVLEEMK